MPGTSPRTLPLSAVSIALGMMLVAPSPALEVAIREPGRVAVAGSPMEVVVEMRYAAGETPDLFSFGVRLLPAPAAGVSAEAIEVVPELDHSGFADGALVSLPDLGAKGNVTLASVPAPAYEGSELLRFRFVPAQAGPLELGLDLYRTAGPQEDVFVTTGGATLDDQITFIPATLQVLDAPRLSLRRLPGEARLELIFDLVAGYRTRVLQSDDLSAWRPLSTATGEGTVILYHDLADRSTGFFRLDCQPLDDG